ncbi:FAD/NAD(P)-binding protein [Moritella sp. 5]|uniref:FAD/NAD(P)-binding protein n=1 Tax=Moritella sp. 5 TaxID=2746231 RepID=UPI001BA5BBFC|nr:FAD/NAD(P)-binding domain-containing protein [Moritella sp. 5]QUM80338.1 FAD/NAD(P)-binding protein [Moritella sp. 5]
MIKVRKLAIIGGGPSGIAVYLEAIKSLHMDIETITIFDPQGLANGFSFNSCLTSTLTNTSIGTTSLHADDKLDYYKWFLDRGSHKSILPSDFVSRSLFRDYCKDRVEQSSLFAASFKCETVVKQIRVTSMSMVDQKICLRSDDGNSYLFDAVVVATGVEQLVPLALRDSDSSNVVKVAYPETNFLDKVTDNSQVLVLGSKLSAIDVSIAIYEHSANAEVTMISKSGELPSVRSSLLIRAENGNNNWLKAFISSSQHQIKDIQQQLELDIKKCKTNSNIWQDFIGEFADDINERWPKLSEQERLDELKCYKVFMKRFVSSFPLSNAEKLLSMIKNNKLKVIAGDIDRDLKINDDSISCVQKGDTLDFDIVINATGVTNKPISKEMIIALEGKGVSINELGGLKINSHTMRVESEDNQVPIYVCGGPAQGELLITNYVRSSVVQAKKIVMDIANIIKQGHKIEEVECGKV